MDDTVSGWVYVALGFVLGAAVGVLAAPLLRPQALLAGPEAPEDKPGLVSRAFKKIPTRVKLAGAVGAVKGAGSEAYREVRHRLAQEKG